MFKSCNKNSYKWKNYAKFKEHGIDNITLIYAILNMNDMLLFSYFLSDSHYLPLEFSDVSLNPLKISTSLGWEKWCSKQVCKIVLHKSSKGNHIPPNEKNLVFNFFKLLPCRTLKKKY